MGQHRAFGNRLMLRRAACLDDAAEEDRENSEAAGGEDRAHDGGGRACSRSKDHRASGVCRMTQEKVVERVRMERKRRSPDACPLDEREHFSRLRVSLSQMAG